MQSEAVHRHVALLRGINVGGKNLLPIRDLTVLFAENGCENVQTYIQSGNVVFTATPEQARQLPALLTTQIAARWKLDVPVLLRNHAQMQAILQNNPYLQAGVDPQVLHVLFLATPPQPAQLAKLQPDRSPPDEFSVLNQEIFLRCPHGVGRSRLTNAYFDAKLATTTTLRNWRTVQQLTAMLGER